MREEYQKLVEKAFEVLTHAYVPYSNFRVGACLEMKDGNYITGVNIENASYGLSNCAERSAIFAAYSRGYQKEDIKAMAIVTRAEKLTTPCGACRQVLGELLRPETPIILTNGTEEFETDIRTLLPYSFDEKSLNQTDNINCGRNER